MKFLSQIRDKHILSVHNHISTFRLDKIERKGNLQQFIIGLTGSDCSILVVNGGFTKHQQRTDNNIHTLVGGKGNLTVVVCQEVYNLFHCSLLVGWLSGIELVNQILQFRKTVNRHLISITQIGNLTISGTDVPTFTDGFLSKTRIDGAGHNSSYRTDIVFEHTSSHSAESKILLPIDCVLACLVHTSDDSGNNVRIIE